MTNVNVSAPELMPSIQDEIALISAHLDNLSTLFEGYIMSHQVKAMNEDEMTDVTHTTAEIRKMLRKKQRELQGAADQIRHSA